MRLPEAEVELFYELYHPLLVYANQRLEVVEGIDSPGDTQACHWKRSTRSASASTNILN